jgi:hypothetical protein
MNRAKWSGRVILVLEVFIVAWLVFSGCAAKKTWVQIGEYKPQFTKDWNQYKGKSVYLMNFDNQANDTSIWYYYSKDQKFYYGTDSTTIHNYFWYAFNDAFANAGIAVSCVDHPDLTAPAMWVTLRSITDERYNVRVTVQKKGASTLSKDYSTEEAVPAEADRSPPAMAQHAYMMTNKLIESILGDPDFQKIITES